MTIYVLSRIAIDRRILSMLEGVGVSLAKTLALPSLSASATVEVRAALAKPLVLPSLSISATVDLKATLARALPVPSLSALARVDLFLTEDKTLAVPTLVFFGRVYYPLSHYSRYASNPRYRDKAYLRYNMKPYVDLTNATWALHTRSPRV